MGRVDGKVAFITGAARGLGRSYALRLAEEGANIVAVDICQTVDSAGYPGATENDLQETVRLVEKLDRRIVSRVTDVRSSSQLDDAIAAGLSEFGAIDIVAANAGIGSFGPTWLLTDDQWQDTIDINLTGVWRTCRAVIPHMIERGSGGSIVITSSAGALRANANMAHYASAKLGLVALMRVLATELGEFGIRVNTVHPCEVDTPMMDNDDVGLLFMGGVPAASRDERRDRVADVLRPLHMLPIPWVDPIDVSNALLYLASDEARYVTGTSMRIDAGYGSK